MLGAMSTRERPADRGRRLARLDRQRVGSELRDARQRMGRSLDAVARSAAMSASQVGRIERGALPAVSVDQLARLGAAVGLDVRVRAYPGPDLVLDAGQLALLDRLRLRLHPDLTLRLEVPLPILGDQRAFDGTVGGLRDGPDGVAVLPVECETRVVNEQDQVRRIMLKLRDSGFEHVLLVVADTRRNREAIRMAADLFRDAFPVSSRQALACLSRGRHPGGSAIVVL
jgi:transcriptional regulator with XRE-family HTH domain